MSKGQHRKPRHHGKHRKPAPVPNMAHALAPVAIGGALVLSHHHPAPLTAIKAEHQPPRPVAAAPPHHPHHYTVKSGDTLSKIAKREYGKASDWPALWWVNKGKVHNPNMILVGERLRLSPWHPHRAWLTRAAMRAIPVMPAPRAHTVLVAARHNDPAPVNHTVISAAPGSFQACVIARESGGNPSAVNPSSGAGGLYQFLPSTWAGLGYSGLPQNAPVWEQNQAFQKEYSESGTSAWAPYDGC